MPRAFFVVLTIAIWCAIGFYNVVVGLLHNMIQLFHFL